MRSKNCEFMCKKNSGNTGICPDCEVVSTRVHAYKTRSVSHYAIGKIEKKLVSVIVFGCLNSVCGRKTFRVLACQDGSSDVIGRSRYTESSKRYVSNRLLKQHQSYNSLKNEIRTEYGGKTGLSTLHTWVQKTKLCDVAKAFDQMEVLHTDEKHPSKKKEKRTINLS